MSKQTHERSILTEATFRITNHDGQQVEVRRDLLIWENTDAEWFISVGEPDATDDPEGELVASGMIRVPVEAWATLDDLFTLVADPAVVGARTR